MLLKRAAKKTTCSALSGEKNSSITRTPYTFNISFKLSEIRRCGLHAGTLCTDYQIMMGKDIMAKN